MDNQDTPAGLPNADRYRAETAHHDETSTTHTPEADTPAGSDAPMEHRIRTRAYELWEQEGQPEGRAEAHWEAARRHVEQSEQGRVEHSAQQRVDQSAQQSFPASDAPANSGIAGPNGDSKP